MSTKKAVLITGASSGMGQACVHYFLNQNFHVIGIDMNDNTEHLNKDSYTFFQANLCHYEVVEEIFKQIESSFYDVRIGIHCAGIATGHKILNKDGPMAIKDFSKTIEINLIAGFNILRLCSNLMQHNTPEKEGERGLFINTASVAAYEGQIGQCAYSASKSGVIGYTLPAARELARHGIRVNTIAPGLISTPMMESLPEPVKDKLIEQTLFPKRLGKADEFAKLCFHLYENKLINGETIRMDGAVRLPPR